MDRRSTILKYGSRIVVLLAAVVLSTEFNKPACAQSPSAQNVYTIVGDVNHPGTYAWPDGQTVSLQAVLSKAGALGPSGRAFIRRANQPKQPVSIEFWFNRGGTTPLAAGDTIVWRSVQSPRLQAGSIVLLTEHGMALQSIPISGVSLRTVLEAASLPVYQRPNVHRSGWDKHSTFRMDLDSIVMHGDILNFRNIAPVQTASTFQEAPNATSGISRNATWSHSGTPGLLIPQTGQPPESQPVSNSQLVSGGDTAEHEIIPAHPLHIPGHSTDAVADDRLNHAELSGNLGFGASFSQTDPQESETTDSWGEASPDQSPPETLEDEELARLADAALNIGSPEPQEANSSFLSGLFLFGLLLALGLITVGIVRTRQEQRMYDSVRIGADSSSGSATTKATTASSDLNSVASSDPKQTKSSQSFTQLPAFAADPEEVAEEDSAISSWPSVAAIPETTESTLEECPVLSVGLNQRQESNSAASETETPNIQDADATDSTNLKIAAATEEQTASETVARQVLPVETELNSDLSVTATNADDLPDEDLWLSENQSENRPESEPESTTIQSTLAEDAVTAPSAVEDSSQDELLNLPQDVAADSGEDADDVILELPDVDAVRNAITSDITHPERDAAPNRQTVEEVASEEVDSIEDESTDEAEAATVEVPQTIQNQNHIMEHVPMSDNEADYLEDLIQNRLPMELTDAQLPLRVNLFGKPEGPRRLRIDAAHTEIAPPHMAMSARQNRRPQTAMAATASQKATTRQNTEPAAATEAAAQQTSAEADSARQRAGQGTTTPAHADQRTTSTNNANTGLDKALNFLEEQSKS